MHHLPQSPHHIAVAHARGGQHGPLLSARSPVASCQEVVQSDLNWVGLPDHSAHADLRRVWRGALIHVVLGWRLPLQYHAGRQSQDGSGGMQDVFAGTEITLSFAEEDRPGYFAIINEDMELAELGWTTFPKLMHLGWAAQWLEYEGRLKANLSRPALEVPIFKETVSCQPALALLASPITATCLTPHASVTCDAPLLSLWHRQVNLPFSRRLWAPSSSPICLTAFHLQHLGIPVRSSIVGDAGMY